MTHSHHPHNVSNITFSPSSTSIPFLPIEEASDNLRYYLGIFGGLAAGNSVSDRDDREKEKGCREKERERGREGEREKERGRDRGREGRGEVDGERGKEAAISHAGECD